MRHQEISGLESFFVCVRVCAGTYKDDSADIYKMYIDLWKMMDIQAGQPAGIKAPTLLRFVFHVDVPVISACLFTLITHASRTYDQMSTSMWLYTSKAGPSNTHFTHSHHHFKTKCNDFDELLY